MTVNTIYRINLPITLCMTQLDFAALEAGILHKWDMAERAKYESEPVLLRLWIKLNATERILNLDPEY